MRLTFWYAPATNLEAEVRFYRESLGLEEAWSEGDDTVAFWMPERDVQIMVSTTAQPGGPMYIVDDVGAWMDSHPEVPVSIDRYDIPGGSVAAFVSPSGSTFYVFDQPDRS